MLKQRCAKGSPKHDFNSGQGTFSPPQICYKFDACQIPVKDNVKGLSLQRAENFTDFFIRTSSLKI